jgi:hypothetical protein
MNSRRSKRGNEDALLREIQGEASRINDLFQQSSSHRSKVEKALEVFLKSSEENEGLLKDFSRKMGELDEKGAEEVHRVRVMNAFNVKMAKGILANFGRIRDLKTNSLIVS